jgi:hypothetical protein
MLDEEIITVKMEGVEWVIQPHTLLNFLILEREKKNYI